MAKDFANPFERVLGIQCKEKAYHKVLLILGYENVISSIAFQTHLHPFQFYFKISFTKKKQRNKGQWSAKFDTVDNFFLLLFKSICTLNEYWQNLPLGDFENQNYY